MTRQKFYEICIKRTLVNAAYEEDHPLHDEVSCIEDIENSSLDEIMMRIKLAGGGYNIPRKENFKSWGVRYLAQLLGFVVSENDDEFTRQFFTFLKRNTTLYKKKEDRKQLGNVCFQAFVDVVVGYKELAMMLSEFMIFNFRDEDWFGDFLKCVHALGYLTLKAQEEYERIVYGETITESISKNLNKTKVEK